MTRWGGLHGLPNRSPIGAQANDTVKRASGCAGNAPAHVHRAATPPVVYKFTVFMIPKNTPI